MLYEAVAFDSPKSGSDGQGGTVSGWQEEHACRAHFRYLRGGEAVQQARLEGRQPVVVTIRNCVAARALKTDWRMRDRRNVGEFNIRSIIPSDDRQFIELTCERGVTV